jgi:hypothetical protein
MKTQKIIQTIMILLLTAGMTNLVTGCTFDLRDPDSSGDLTTQTRQVSSFTGLRVGGAFDVVLKQGDSYGVVVQADADIIDYITTEVKDGILHIGMKEHHQEIFHNNSILKVTVTYKEITSLDLSGASEVKTENRLNGTDLSIESSGASEVKLDMAVQNLEMTLSGASKLNLTGTAAQGKIDASGASEVNAAELAITNLSIYGSGAIDAKVNVSGTLKANVSGACTVKYLGNPSVDVRSSGASTIKRAN